MPQKAVQKNSQIIIRSKIILVLKNQIEIITGQLPSYREKGQRLLKKN